MENQNEQSGLIKHAVRFGVITGIATIVFTILLYVIDYSLMVNWKIALVFLALFIGLVIYAGIAYRKEVGGYLSFGNAFLHGYILLIVGGILGTIFSIILYTVVDPELPQKLTDVVIQNTEEMMQSFGAPEAKIDEQLDKMKVDMPKDFSALGQIKKFGWGILINAVICLITGAIVKKNQPVEL